MRIISCGVVHECRDWQELMKWLEYEVECHRNAELHAKQKRWAKLPIVFAAVETAVLMLIK